MYIVSSLANMVTNNDRFGTCKFPVNGSVSFSFFQDLIFFVN